MSIFDEAEASVDPNAAEPDMKDVASYRRLKFKGQREELLKDIPHEKKLCTLAEEDRFCERCTPLYNPLVKNSSVLRLNSFRQRSG